MGRKIFYTIIATAINVVGGILRNKIFASFLALNLFGIFSIGQQSVGVLFTFFAFGLPLGITTLSSQIVSANTEEQQSTISRIILLCGIVGGVILAVLTAIILIDPTALSIAITNKPDYALAINLLLLSAPLTVIETCLYSIMEGMGKLREIMIFKIIPAVIILPALYVLTSHYSITGAAIGSIANELLLVITGLVVLRHNIHFTSAVMKLKPIITQILKTAILSFGVGLSFLVADFVVKRYILGVMGETDNAIVQSVAKVTDLYPNVALAWLAMHIFPELGKRRGDMPGSANVIERTTLVAVGIIVPIILVLFVFRSLILELIYKKEFNIATDYFGVMLAVGIPKVYSWTIGSGFLPMGHRRYWFYQANILTGLYVVGSLAAFGAHASIYFLPILFGFAMIAQSGYAWYGYSRLGLTFSTDFVVQSLCYIAMTVLVGLAVKWEWAILGVLAMYMFIMLRYGLIQELFQKINDFREKAAS